MDELLQKQYECVLASLFHDIGKFKQRAFGGKPHSNFPETMKGMILPSSQGIYGYQHALWTFDFFDNDLKECQLPKSLDWNKIRDMASKHHNPSSFAEEIIKKADSISSSIDRTETEEHYTKGEYLKKHLKSIFPQIVVEHNKPEAIIKTYGYQLRPLDENSAFPVILPNEDISLQNDYNELWTKFTQHFKKMCYQWGKDTTIQHFVQSTLHLLKQYTWCVPAATNDKLCDSSLYDHAVSTAAIAIVLQNYCKDKLPYDDEPVFLIFAADISGIQQFIFQRHHEVFKGSSKIIRGRSFFVSSIGIAFQQLLYRELGIVPYTQLLSSSGKFYLLLPNTQQCKEKLSKVVDEANKWLFKEFHADFAIVTDNEVVASCNDLSKNFAALIESINYNLSVSKFKKFKNVLQEGNCVIDVDYTEEEICPSCGKYTKEKAHQDGEGRCKFCNTMLDIGSALVHRPLYLVLDTKKGDINFFDNALGLHFANDVIPYQNAFAIYTFDKEKADTCMLWEFNNYVPLVDYEIKTFSQIAETSIIHYLDDEDDTKRGVPLLSFVKMDVDNLGFIFSQGIPQLSISRYVTVSRMLNYFFNTVVYHILSSQFPNAYTVLSGGDDLFIVAPFRVTIALIKKIYEEFKRFTCNNPDVHFSTGIFVSHDNFPMSKAAELAEESLESAKEKNKNAVYYFDVIGYENLFEIEKNIKWIEDKLLDKKSNVSQAFIYRLLKYTRMAKSKTFEKYLYLPKFKYDIARNIVKKDNGKIINADEVNWIENFFEKNVARNTTWLEATIVTGIYFTRKY